MSVFPTLLVTGIGLGGLYYLVASGLSLTYGLARILNFAHGTFLTVGAYAAWQIAAHLNGAGVWQYVIALAGCLVIGGLVAAAVELVLIRPLYGRPIEQVLVTVGLALALVALAIGIFTENGQQFPAPSWTQGVWQIAGQKLPLKSLIAIGGAAIVFAALSAFLRYTRWGLIIRAGVENRAMVTALGIDVQRAFTLVFALGGVVAALGGALFGVTNLFISPYDGQNLLIFAFIVVVIGGLGSQSGTLLAALLVGLVQQLLDYYVTFNGAFAAAGDISVVLLLALVLLVRPQGLLGRAA